LTEEKMKQLRRTCLGLLMLLALSVPALAGDIPSPPAPAGPQESPGLTGEIPNPPSANGIMPNGDGGDISSPPSATGDIQAPGVTGDILCPGITLIFLGLF
jgi:hypothetical protein